MRGEDRPGPFTGLCACMPDKGLEFRHSGDDDLQGQGTRRFGAAPVRYLQIKRMNDMLRLTGDPGEREFLNQVIEMSACFSN